MSEDALLRLAAGPLELLLAPARGGSIARFDYIRGAEIIPVLRGLEGDATLILDHASFPLVPFCNRIRNGRFSFRGKDVTLSQNMPGDDSPLHGQGWTSCWEVVAAGPTEAELRFRHEADEWPWTYEARQVFTLSATGLAIRLACRNLSDEAMPCGLGQHPYFHCTSETRLDTRVEDVWTVDEKVLPVDRVPADGRYDLRDRAICGQGLDNGFSGWGGAARIETPGIPFVTAVTSPNAGYFQVYSPEAGGIFVAEPVSHANAALNEPEADWARLGIRLLDPGEEMALDCWIGLAGDHFSA